MTLTTQKSYNKIDSEKQLLFIDMDGVLADFDASHFFNEREIHRAAHGPHEMYEVGFFESLPVIDGARAGIRALLNTNKYDINILTKPVRFSSTSYQEKANWIWKNFPELGEKLILTQNKTLLSGPSRILIDDSKEEWGNQWQKYGGSFHHFDYDHGDQREEWWQIIKQFCTKEEMNNDSRYCRENG